MTADYKCVKIRTETYNKLAELGNLHDSFSSVIERLVETRHTNGGSV